MTPRDLEECVHDLVSKSEITSINDRACQLFPSRPFTLFSIFALSMFNLALWPSLFPSVQRDLFPSEGDPSVSRHVSNRPPTLCPKLGSGRIDRWSLSRFFWQRWVNLYTVVCLTLLFCYVWFVWVNRSFGSWMVTFHRQFTVKSLGLA